MRRCLVAKMIEMDCMRIQEKSTAVPTVSFWPESQCCEPRRFADGGPRTQRLFIRGDEVDQQRSIGRQVAAPLVNAAFEPLSFLKSVFFQIPLDELGVRRRPAPRSEEHTSELQSHHDLHSFLHDALPICAVNHGGLLMAVQERSGSLYVATK